MNFTSSIAKTFVGSAIASVSVVPDRPTGSTLYLVALSGGTRRTTEGSRSNSRRLMAGTPQWRLTTAVMSSSAMIPSLTRLVLSRPPCWR